MALSRKKKKVDIPEDKIEDFINKGGGVQPEDEVQPKKVKKSKPAREIRVQLRINSVMLEDIDKAVKKRPGKLSRHTWILEAIAAKLDEEG